MNKHSLPVRAVDLVLLLALAGAVACAPSANGGSQLPPTASGGAGGGSGASGASGGRPATGGRSGSGGSDSTGGRGGSPAGTGGSSSDAGLDLGSSSIDTGSAAGGQGGGAGGSGGAAMSGGSGGAGNPGTGGSQPDAGSDLGPRDLGSESPPVEDPRSKNWVFLMAGQSNMAGLSFMEAEDQIAPERVFKLARNKTWIPAYEPANINPWVDNAGPPQKVGVQALSPSRTFGIELLKGISDPGVNIYIINIAVSGSNIESWQPSTGINFKNMIPYLEEGMKKGIVRGFMWHQGEANGGTPPAEYAGRLREIITAIRTKVGNPDLPAAAGEVGYTSDDVNFVNRALAMLGASEPHFEVVTSENFCCTTDVHYAPATERELGRRFAAAYWRALDK